MIDVNPKEEITFFIDSIGIPKWEENFAIVERLEMLENLPAEIQEQNRLLKDYCRLRIELYEVISKAVVYESPIYLVDINNKNKRIAELLDELNN